MNPLDIHLKFTDQKTAIALLLEAGIWLTFKDEDGNVIYYDAPDYLSDVIGLIYKPTSAKIQNENGIETNVMADVGGWHVNMRGELPAKLEQYKVTVTGTPYRVWA